MSRRYASYAEWGECPNCHTKRVLVDEGSVFFCPECSTVFQREDYEAYLRGEMPELETPVGFFDYETVYNEDDDEIICLDHPTCDGTIGKKNGKYYCRKCGKRFSRSEIERYNGEIKD